MKLFQYWNDIILPDDVKEWQATFRNLNPEFDYQLFNRDSAADFIRDHYGTRYLSAFLSLKVPAMQADFIRLCLIVTYGGIYCDIDHRLKEALSSLTQENQTDLMFEWGGMINTAFLLFRRPQNIFLLVCLEICTKNVLNRRFNTAIMSTGPGIQNAIRVAIDPASLLAIEKYSDIAQLRDWGFYELVDIVARIIGTPTQDLRDAFSAIKLRHTFYLIRWMDSDAPVYKGSDRHWLHWRGPIYES